MHRFNCILFRIISIHTRGTYPAGLNVKREVNPLKPIPGYPDLLYALFVYTLAFSNTIYDISVCNVSGFSQNNINQCCDAYFQGFICEIVFKRVLKRYDSDLCLKIIRINFPNIFSPMLDKRCNTTFIVIMSKTIIKFYLLRVSSTEQLKKAICFAAMYI